MKLATGGESDYDSDDQAFYGDCDKIWIALVKVVDMATESVDQHLPQRAERGLGAEQNTSAENAS